MEGISPQQIYFNSLQESLGWPMCGARPSQPSQSIFEKVSIVTRAHYSPVGIIHRLQLLTIYTPVLSRTVGDDTDYRISIFVSLAETYILFYVRHL